MFDNKIILVFIVSFLLTLVFSWNGDDDIAYLFFNRKPTGSEAVRRIRFVLSKLLASVIGGSMTAVFFVKYVLLNVFDNISMSKNQTLLFIIFFIILFSAFIGVMQNIIRLNQERVTRPVIDLSVIIFNIKNFIRRRK